MADGSVTVLRFEGFALDLERRVLVHGDQEVHLRPKSFDVLAQLAGAAGMVLGKDELMAAVWPGVVVTDESLTRCISDIRAALGDGEQRLIKTVPRRGYVLAVHAAPDTSHVVSASRNRRWPWAAAAAAVVLLAGFAAWQPWLTRPEASGLSIVVMPLSIRGGDAQQAYLADAVAEEMGVDLARIPGVSVIGRSTADT